MTTGKSIWSDCDDISAVLAMLTHCLLVCLSGSVVSAGRSVLTASGCGSVKLRCEEGGMMVVREASFKHIRSGDCQGAGKRG